jgi:hypothetical protein
MFFRKARIYSAVTECFNELTDMEKVLVSEFIDSIKRNQPQAYKQPDIELLAGVIVDDLVYRKLLPFLQLNFRGRQLQMKANQVFTQALKWVAFGRDGNCRANEPEFQLPE